MAEVELSGVSKRFGDVVAVADLSLAMPDGEFVVLLGPTGVGKTTTLRLVAGLETPDTGTIRIGGRDVTHAGPAERDVAFVFQQYSLYPHLSVYDNLAFPLRSPLRKVPEDQVKKRVTEIARMLRIDDKLANSATRLSGGQMQRVAIGRALVRRPAVFLMDEPLSSLDAKLRAELRLELKRIHLELGATILYVTHDQIEAMTMANRIGVMDAGRLVQVGTPREIYQDPATAYVATRLGQPGVNLLPRSLFPDIPAPQAAVTIGARTEHLRLTRANGKPIGVTGSLSWIEHLGDQNHLHIRLGESELVTLADPDSELEVGDSVAIELTQPLFFGADGDRIPGPGGMKLGFNLLLWTTHVTDAHAPILEALKATGYDGVEIPVFEGTPDHYATLGRRLAAMGLGATALTVIPTADKNPLGESEAERKAARDYIDWAMQCTSALGANILCGPLHSTLGHFTGRPRTDAEWQRAIEFERAMGDRGKALGVRLAVEAVNRFECYFATTVDELATFIDAVDHPAIQAMYDTFHAHIEERDVGAAIGRLGKRLIHVHLSENDRGTPGEGQVAWTETFSALKGIGYDGWLTVEAFGRALPELAAATRVWRDLFDEPSRVYRGAHQLIRAGWRAA